jgi:hypothetical protein
MTCTDRLKKALLDLATSPVKADRNAIERIERVTGESAYTIVTHLDDLLLSLDSTEEQEESNREILSRAIARGAWTASVAGLAVLLSNPQSLPNGLALGAIAGISSEFLSKKK